MPAPVAPPIAAPVMVPQPAAVSTVTNRALEPLSSFLSPFSLSTSYKKSNKHCCLVNLGKKLLEKRIQAPGWDQAGVTDLSEGWRLYLFFLLLPFFLRDGLRCVLTLKLTGVDSSVHSFRGFENSQKVRLSRSETLPPVSRTTRFWTVKS
jgi:hypothetical protein